MRSRKSFTATPGRFLLLGVSLLSLHCGAPVDDDDATTPPVVTPTDAPVASLTANPTSLDFGEVAQGDSDSLTVQISNSGDVAVTLLYASSQGDNSGWFSTSSFGGSNLAPGQSAELTVTFAPLNKDEASATLTIVTEPSAAGINLQVKGMGTCVDNDGDDYCVEVDCNDSDVTANPGRYEICDGVDNDCNGEIDDSPKDADSFYRDSDEDGYGIGATEVVSCEPPPGRGWATQSGDCDDNDAEINPDALEICDGVDNNCNGREDEAVDVDEDGAVDCRDNDGDGYCADATFCSDGSDPGDCDDQNGDNAPGGEDVPDGQDNNCNGEIDDNSPPTISFVEPRDGTVVTPDSTITLVIEVRDAQDEYFGTRLPVLITESSIGTICEGEADAEGMFYCDMTLPYGGYSLSASTMDSAGLEGTATLSVSADNPPTVQIVYPTEGLTVEFGAPTPFNAVVSDPDGSAEPQGSISFVWTSDRLGEVGSGTVTGGIATSQIALSLEGPHLMTITVTDRLGGEGSASVTVVVGEPDCSPAKATIALYHMDEGAGDVIADSSGNLLDGLVVSAAWEQSAKFGAGVVFNGVDSYIQVENTDNLLSLNTFTIETWVKVTLAAPQPVSRMPLIYKNTSATSSPSQENYDLRLGQTGAAQVKIERAGVPPTEYTASGATPVARNEWHLVTATYDGAVLSVYLDGQLEGSSPVSDITLQQGSAPMYLGTDKFSTASQPRTLTGVLDEVRILGCALSAGQIQGAYGTGNPNPDPETEEPTPVPAPGQSE